MRAMKKDFFPSQKNSYSTREIKRDHCQSHTAEHAFPSGKKCQPWIPRDKTQWGGGG